jgi:hypothetical protein
VHWLPVSTFAASPLAWWRPNEVAFRGEPSSYTYGKGFDTRGANGILFLDIRSQVDGTGLIRVSNRPDLGKDRDLRTRGPRVARVEAALVVPALRGRDIRPFSSNPSLFVLAAHYPEDRSQALESGELSRTYPAARTFLSYFRDKLLARRPYLGFRPNESCWWQLQGTNHMDRGYLVCISEIADPPAAAVVGVQWSPELGRSVLPMPDHKVTFFNTNSEDEAYFLCGLFNSAALQVLIARFANFTAVSPATLRYLPIPKFDPGSEVHQMIAAASQEAHMANGDAARRQASAQVDELVGELMMARAPN